MATTEFGRSARLCSKMRALITLARRGPAFSYHVDAQGPDPARGLLVSISRLAARRRQYSQRIVTENCAYLRVSYSLCPQCWDQMLNIP